MPRKVGDLRSLLEALVSEATLTPEARTDFNLLLSELQRYDTMSVRAFVQMLARVRQPAEPSAHDVRTAGIAAALKTAFGDDDRFRAELQRIQSDRSITRNLLNDVFQALTGRTRKLSAKATKARLAQDIADYRLEQVRSERAAELFNTKPTFAE